MQPFRLPPPPFVPGASPWEGIVTAEVQPLVSKLVARRVQGLAWADLEAEDGVQRILIEVTLACRRWAKCHGPAKPAERYVWAAVHRARAKLYRSVKRAGPRTFIRPADTAEQDAPAIVVRSDCPGPDEVVEWRTTQRLYVEVTAGLFAGMDPGDEALLRLSAEGFAPSDIAAHVGRPGDNVHIAQRLYILRKRAREQLARLGIESLEDVHTFRGTRADVHAPD